MEGREYESYCRAAIERMDECLNEAEEFLKSVHPSLIGSREPMKPALQPTKLSKGRSVLTLQLPEDSNERPKRSRR